MRKRAWRRPGAYCRLNRTWQAGDSVTLKLDLAPRVVRAPGSAKFAALGRGPVVLAQDARLVRPESTARLAVGAGTPVLRLVPQKADSPFWLVGEAPAEAGGKIPFCDFASAGNTWSAESTCKVWFEVP